MWQKHELYEVGSMGVPLNELWCWIFEKYATCSHIYIFEQPTCNSMVAIQTSMNHEQNLYL